MGGANWFRLRTCEFPNPNRVYAPKRDPGSDRAEIVGSLAEVEAVAVDEARFVGSEASRSAGCRSKLPRRRRLREPGEDGLVLRHSSYVGSLPALRACVTQSV